MLEYLTSPIPTNQDCKTGAYSQPVHLACQLAGQANISAKKMLQLQPWLGIGEQGTAPGATDKGRNDVKPAVSLQ